ncbi:MAG: WG repeat-containing protein [Bacteroidales bacterium]|nr:WG repeat-containing protein [Bacteroidales bacterium]
MLLVSTNISNAQNKNNGEYIIPAVVNEKWGFINEYGQWIVEPKFESIDDFKTNGLARIKQNNKYGVINTSGEIVVKPQYDNIRIVGDLI